MIPAQYQDALSFTETIIEKIDKAVWEDKIILTGHSLGGGLASYATIRLNRPSVSAVVFNAAGLGEGITSAIKSLSDTQIAQIKSQMNGGLSPEFQYLSDMLNTLISDAKFGINIPSITNIHLVGDPVALFPGQQAGIFTLLTVPPNFIWSDNSGKQIQKFSTLASHLPADLAYTGPVYQLIPDGWFAPLVGDATYTKLLISDYTSYLQTTRQRCAIPAGPTSLHDKRD